MPFWLAQGLIWGSLFFFVAALIRQDWFVVVVGLAATAWQGLFTRRRYLFRSLVREKDRAVVEFVTRRRGFDAAPAAADRSEATHESLSEPQPSSRSPEAAIRNDDGQPSEPESVSFRPSRRMVPFPAPAPTAPTPTSPTERSAADRLRQLDEAHDTGLVSRDEYDQKRKQILREL